MVLSVVMKNNIAIFTDIEGTLCFGQSHGIKKVHDGGSIEPREGKSSRVVDMACVTVPGYSEERKVFNLSERFAGRTYQIYMDPVASVLLDAVSSIAEVYVVTGARKATIEKRYDFFDFADGFIIENGGVILDKDLEVDEEWEALLTEELALLKEMRRKLKYDGLDLDVKGRNAMIRVRRDQNEHLSDEQFERVYEDLRVQVPVGLKVIRNLGHIDILPEKAGKEGAVKYVMEKNGIEKSIGIGDDINDIGFLSIVDQPFIMGNSDSEVINVFRNNEAGYISKEKYFKGIIEILEEIRRRLRKGVGGSERKSIAGERKV